MRFRKQIRDQGHPGFFLLALSDETLVTFYNINTILICEHKISLEDIYSMIPWERSVYTKLIKEYVRRKNATTKQMVDEFAQ